MGLRTIYARRIVLAGVAVVVCGLFLAELGTAGAGAAPTTTTTPPAPSSVGVSTTTTTAPQHVVNQPNLNALTPHVVPLHGSGVQYQFSSRAPQEKAPTSRAT